MRLSRCFLFIVIMISFSAVLPAQEAGQAEGQAPDTGTTDETALTFSETGNTGNGEFRQDTSSIWTYVSVVLVLALIVAGIYVLFYFMKKASAVRYGDSDEIRIVSTKALSNTRQLFIVEIGNEFSLVGSGENGVTHLKEITDPETIDRLRLVSAEQPKSGRGKFQDILSGLFAGAKQNTQESSNISNTSTVDTQTSKTFLKRQQDRLKKL